VIAVLLTSVGQYGLLSYAAAQRRREIGLRIALGAHPGQVRPVFIRMAIGLLTLGGVPGPHVRASRISPMDVLNDV
jgi:ABC-type antimicrobial peptide transport system permease subunit